MSYYQRPSRTIRLLNAILANRESSMMTISGVEDEIKRNAANVRLVNKVSKNTLRDIMPSDPSSWLQAQEMLRFASTVTTEDEAKDALDLLRAAEKSDLDFKPNVLTELVGYAKEHGIPPEWALSGFIADKPEHKKTSLDDGFFINREGI